MLLSLSLFPSLAHTYTAALLFQFSVKGLSVMRVFEGLFVSPSGREQGNVGGGGGDGEREARELLTGDI